MGDDICSECNLLQHPEKHLITRESLEIRGWRSSTIHTSGKIYDIGEINAYVKEIRCNGTHTCYIQFESDGNGKYKPTQRLK